MPNPPLQSDLLYALEVLCNAPPELVYANRDLAAWKQVGAVVNSTIDAEPIDTPADIQANISSGSSSLSCLSSPRLSSNGSEGSCSSRLSSPLPPSNALEYSSRLTPPPEKRKREPECKLNKLFCEMGNVLPKLLKFSEENRQLSTILCQERSSVIDERISFLKCVSGNKTPNEGQKLLMGLSQLSLASNFTLWQMKRKEPLRVDEIRLKLSKVSKKNGNITRYVIDENIPEADRSVIERGIREGLSKIAFIKLLRIKLEESKKDAATGMMGMLMLAYMKFRGLTFDQYPQYIDLLVFEDKSAPIIDPINNLSKWFATLWSDFELQYSRNTTVNSLDLTQTENTQSHPLNPPSNFNAPQHSPSEPTQSNTDRESEDTVTRYSFNGPIRDISASQPSSGQATPGIEQIVPQTQRGSSEERDDDDSQVEDSASTYSNNGTPEEQQPSSKRRRTDNASSNETGAVPGLQESATTPQDVHRGANIENMLNPVDTITRNRIVPPQAENSGIGNMNEPSNTPTNGYWVPNLLYAPQDTNGEFLNGSSSRKTPTQPGANPQNTYRRARAGRGSEATLITPVGNVETTGIYTSTEQNRLSAINILADKRGIVSTQTAQQGDPAMSFLSLYTNAVSDNNSRTQQQSTANTLRQHISVSGQDNILPGNISMSYLNNGEGEIQQENHHFDPSIHIPLSDVPDTRFAQYAQQQTCHFDPSVHIPLSNVPDGELAQCTQQTYHFDPSVHIPLSDIPDGELAQCTQQQTYHFDPSVHIPLLR